jgi:gamma-glutamyl:cysteine ligase YbdK (ATP-grasp superfamily)
VLALASASSPWQSGEPFGASARMAQEGLLGSLREDREYRFQDLIVSKRLGTIEMRIFDPIPELWRLKSILDAVITIAKYEGEMPFDRDEYNQQRESWSQGGVTPFVENRLAELSAIHPFDRALLDEPLSALLDRIARESGVERAYEEADRIWREPTGTARSAKPHSKVRTVTGLAGYYAVRLPYMAY